MQPVTVAASSKQTLTYITVSVKAKDDTVDGYVPLGFNLFEKYWGL